MITPFRIGWFILSLGLFTLMGYGVARPQFNALLTLYGLVFWGYWRIISPLLPAMRASSAVTISLQQPDTFLFTAAFLFRLALLVVVPNLSDDYIRFIWDGRLLAHGYNPYLYLPSQVVHTPVAATAGLTDALFQGLNSPQYFTVYPPLNQALFGLAAWLCPSSVPGTVIGLRIPILLAELGTMWLLAKLLRRFGKNPNLSLLYGLNPLVILELTGNLHFEAIMIFFVLLSVWLLVQYKWLSSSVALSLGIGAKLLPVILLPLLVRHLGWKRGLLYASATVAFTVFLFLPFLSLELVRNVFSSLDLYFQKFEFNASIYYLVRAVGYWLVGYNPIAGVGFALFVLIGVAVLYIAFRTKSPRSGTAFSLNILATLSLYWLLATTVHPWYITSLVAISLFTPFRYPLIWSGVIILSYATYQTASYTENLWLTALEYGLVVGVGVYEWFQLNQQPI